MEELFYKLASAMAAKVMYPLFVLFGVILFCLAVVKLVSWKRDLLLRQEEDEAYEELAKLKVEIEQLKQSGISKTQNISEQGECA